MVCLTVVDVGAAIGEFSHHVLKNNEVARIYAIEPNITKFGESLLKIKNDFDERISIHPYGLAEKSGSLPLYGSTQINGQIGSLKQFNASKKWNPYLEENLDKSQLAEHIIVHVKSVVDFLSEIGKQEIDFLKIDAQGYDVELLDKFLQFSNVKCSVLEVNTTSDKHENIYESDNNLNALIRVISKYNMNILKIVPNDDFTELNVFLASNIEVGHNIMRSLKISDSPTFNRGWNVMYRRNPHSHKITSKSIFLIIRKVILHPLRTSRKITKLVFNEID
jgi:FkbM family methyltransferase